MTTTHHSQWAEDRREAAAAQHQEAEDQRNAMEDQRQIAEELRDTREHMRRQQGTEHHEMPEQRIARIEAHLERLDERFSQLEQHVMQHIATLHRDSRAQEAQHTAHITQVWPLVAVSNQKMSDTQQRMDHA